MPATRPIIRDEYRAGNAAVTLEQRVQLAQRPVPMPLPDNSNSPSRLGSALAGYRVRGGLRGGGFAPRATSGMRTSS